MTPRERTTVTMFGDDTSLDGEVARELRERGCVTHVLHQPTGWLQSTRIAVIDPYSQAGSEALRQSRDAGNPHARITVRGDAHDIGRSRLRALCAESARHHDVVVVWSDEATDPAVAQALVDHALADSTDLVEVRVSGHDAE